MQNKMRVLLKTLQCGDSRTQQPRPGLLRAGTCVTRQATCSGCWPWPILQGRHICSRERCKSRKALGLLKLPSNRCEEKREKKAWKMRPSTASAFLEVIFKTRDEKKLHLVCKTTQELDAGAGPQGPVETAPGTGAWAGRGEHSPGCGRGSWGVAGCLFPPETCSLRCPGGQGRRTVTALAGKGRTREPLACGTKEEAAWLQLP